MNHAPRIHTPRYGRALEDFEVGQVIEHPWEVTVDHGVRALFQASFLDAMPTFASRRFARARGFADRPLPPALLLNLALSFSVHDVGDRAIGPLSYLDVRFPNACYADDTVRAQSTVLRVERGGRGDIGIVHLRTLLRSAEAGLVCAFRRRLTVRARSTGPLPRAPLTSELPTAPSMLAALPEPLRGRLGYGSDEGGFTRGFLEDFTPGEVICHSAGRTIGESEHMQLASLCRNTHPGHTEEPYARGGGSGTREVFGGLVLAWASALASRDTTGHGLWDVCYDRVSHPNAVIAGDTLYAASKVLKTEPITADAGTVSFRLVATRNERPATLLETGAALFQDESSKDESARINPKVVELERTVLVRRRRSDSLIP